MVKLVAEAAREDGREELAAGSLGIGGHTMRNRYDRDSGTIAQQTYKCEACHQTCFWNQLKAVEVKRGAESVSEKRCPNCGGQVYRI